MHADENQLFEVRFVFDLLAARTAKAYRHFRRHELSRAEAEQVAARAARDAFDELAKLNARFDPEGMLRLSESHQTAWSGPTLIRHLLRLAERDRMRLMSKPGDNDDHARWLDALGIRTMQGVLKVCSDVADSNRPRLSMGGRPSTKLAAKSRKGRS